MHGMHARTKLTMVVAAAAIVSSACTSSGANADKAGGSGEPVTLRLANTYGDLRQLPALTYFVDRVEELSGGDVRIEAMDSYGDYASDAEQQVVRDVASGEVDLGWVGTRVFDTIGVSSLQALTAPMLVDSYALQSAVIESGITEQMLPALDDVGVVGLGVLADGLRKPIGVDGPIVGLEDWRDITFGTLMSDGQAEAIRALGATPAQVFGPERRQSIENGTIQGFEMSIGTYEANALPHLAPYVTSNVNLWPQMDVLLANPARLAAMTAEQRGWIQEAARDAAARSAALADEDAQTLRDACDAGARFGEGSEADLAALQETFAPVYAHLQQDPETKAFIEQIQALKESTPPEPDLVIPALCSGTALGQPAGDAGTAPAFLNGTYRWTLTKEDALANPSEGKSPAHIATFPWVFTMKLDDGTWILTHTEAGQPYTDSPGDSYLVQGDRISFDWPVIGSALTFTFSVDSEGDLYLTPVLPMSAGDQFVWATHPWTKIG